MKRFAAATALIAAVSLSTPAGAVNPDEILDDPALESRARDISANLRCLVCQNQSIDGSDAELARDLRVLVRDRLIAGDSDSQVIEYVVDRYGEFVLLRPRFSMQNLLLWGTPILILVLGGAAAVTYNRRSRTTTAGAALTADEEARLARLLDEKDKR